MNLKELLNKIDENRARIEAFGSFEKSVLDKINYKFRLDWNYYSNRMEGGTLTKEETRSVMVGNISVEGKPIKDVMEMNGHDQVVLDILRIGKSEKRLSESRIKDIHKAIMHEEDPSKREQIGRWKNLANEVINYRNEKIVFSEPSEVSHRMHDLLNATNEQLDLYHRLDKNQKHPAIMASDFHLEYISIHPFYDGNGRTARILTNLILISCGLPVIIIKDDQKDRYYRCLADIQAYGGNKDLFYNFIAERILDSQTLILNALDGKDIDDADDLDKRIALIAKKVSIEDKVKESKSNASVYRVLDEIAFPLFEELQTKCEKLNSLFINHDKHLYISVEGAMLLLGDENMSLAVIKKDWLENKFKRGDLDVTRIDFEYNLRGFKKNLEGQHLMMRVSFQFNDYNYIIVDSRKNLSEGIKKSYTDDLTEKEKKQILTKLIDPMLDEIDGFLGK